MRRIALRGITALVLASLLSGCSPLYFLQAAYEQGKILWRRESIETALQKPDLDPATREKFQLVLEVREYARDALKFNVGGSYATYSYVDRPVLSYIVMAAPKTDLTPYQWSFVVVGRVPYKGFFSEEAAKAEAERLASEEYDTYIRPAPAFSTLGWFNDPLLAHLLKYDKITLAEVIFHELLHNTFFLKGAVDFNESFANFVGNRAAIQFFRERGGEGGAEHRRAVQAWEEELEFSRFIAELTDSLRELYAKEISREEKLRLREEIFATAQQEWARGIADRPTHQYRGFSQQKLNNAVIAHYRLYLRELDLFEALYQSEGGDLPAVVRLVRETVKPNGDPFDTVRDLRKKKTGSA